MENPIWAAITPVTSSKPDFGYLNTFGGNPVSAAAANAVLDVLWGDQLQERAGIVGAELKRRLLQMAGWSPPPCRGRSAGRWPGWAA